MIKLARLCPVWKKARNSTIRLNIYQLQNSFSNSKRSSAKKSTKPPQVNNQSDFSKSLRLSPSAPPQKPDSSQSITVQEKSEREMVIEKERVKALYLELQSLPSDDYETVVENWKRIKMKVIDRRYYAPNKRQFLLRMDSTFNHIKQIHQTYEIPEIGERRSNTDSKAEVIKYELEHAKKQYYLSLLSNEKFLIGVASSLIALVGWIEWFSFVREKDTREKIPSPML